MIALPLIQVGPCKLLMFIYTAQNHKFDSEGFTVCTVHNNIDGYPKEKERKNGRHIKRSNNIGNPPSSEWHDIYIRHSMAQTPINKVKLYLWKLPEKLKNK